MRSALIVLASVVTLTGCSSTVDARRLLSPAEAAEYRGTKLVPVAIMRGDEVADLPDGAVVSVAARVVRVPRPGNFRYHLEAGETVETDAEGHVVAAHGVRVTRFVPGTVVREGDDLVGELATHEEEVPLEPDDRIELKGTLEAGDELPGGGKVESHRAGGAIAFGLVSFILSYGPSAFVAATSPSKSDQWLWAPVVGPWIDLATRPKCTADMSIPYPVDPCLPESLARFGLIVSGILQSSGALLTLIGLPTSAEVRWGDHQARSVRVGPAFGSANGLSVAGNF